MEYTEEKSSISKNKFVEVDDNETYRISERRKTSNKDDEKGLEEVDLNSIRRKNKKIKF